MRIAQLANFVGPTSGGMRRAVDQLGHGYVQAGHERLLVIPGARDAETETADGIVVQVGGVQVTGGYRIILDRRRVISALNRFRPTSLEVSDKWTLPIAARWAKRHGAGSILFSHERLDDMASDFSRLPVGGLVSLLNRRLATRFDRVVVTTSYSAGEWAQTRARLEIVPLGVDLETFVPPGQLPPVSDVARLVHVGRMSREKYPQLAIATAAELHRRGENVQLTLVGTGPHLGMLRDLAGNAPVRFLGYVDGRAEVASLYGTADASISVAPTETFGLAVLEALACGTPVVTADRGGARELVDETCAEWAAPEPEALADAVTRLVRRLRSDPASLRRAARARAERYPWSAAVERMLEIHAEVTQ